MLPSTDPSGSDTATTSCPQDALRDAEVDSPVPDSGYGPNDAPRPPQGQHGPELTQLPRGHVVAIDPTSRLKARLTGRIVG